MPFKAFHSFTGQRNARVKPSGWTQASQRHHVHSFDQYGRKWDWPADNATGMPVGIPQAKFSAPFMPEPTIEYVIVNPENTSELFVDHKAIVRDRSRAISDYHARAVVKCEKNGWPLPRARGEYSDDVVLALGQPPRAPQIVLACLQGNPWALGLDPRPDKRLLKFLDVPGSEVDEELERYDFGAASYEAAVDGVELPTAAKRAPFRSRRAPNAADGAEIEEELQEEARDNATAFTGFDEVVAGVEDEETIELDDDLEDTDDESAPRQRRAVLSGENDVDDDDLDLAAALGIDEDEEDPEALGGRTVKPQNTERTKKQTPRRPTQSASRSKPGSKPARAAASAPPAETDEKGRRVPREFEKGRPTMADGVKPFTGDSAV